MQKSTMSNAYYSQYHEGRIGGDIIGNLTRGCVIDRLATMREQERTTYRYRHYESPPFPQPSGPAVDDSVPPLNSSWREKICHWSFNVIDHFDLSREVVAVSMSLFDRFLATRGNRCNGSTALLASLTTLHIAIKVHEVRKIKISTLANLSRGQFGPRHIEEMEWMVLNTLQWKIHPPTSMSFLSHLLLLLPPQVSDACKEEIYAMSRYITELSVCDSTFVEIEPSAVAFAAILNSLEDRRFRKMISTNLRDQFLRAIWTHVGLRPDDAHVLVARPKLKRLLASSVGQEMPQEGQTSQAQQQAQQHHPQQLHAGGANQSVASRQDSKADDSSLSSRNTRHSRSSSYDSLNRRRVFPIPTNVPSHAMASSPVNRSVRMMVMAPSPSRANSMVLSSSSPCSLSSRSGRSVFSRSTRMSPMALLGA
eukprot:CCRYP_013031-RA/>CCRYP_013031-RA protein AED:0.00 eAED:0.00 QI:327/-1/1/1/-1/1/1/178/422